MHRTVLLFVIGKRSDSCLMINIIQICTCKGFRLGSNPLFVLVVSESALRKLK